MAKTQFPTKKAFSYKSLIGMVIALVAFFVLLTSVIDLTGKYFMTRKRTRDFQNQKIELTEKEAILVEQNMYFETEEGQKQLLREKYNVVGPGEELVIITTHEDTPPPPPAKKKNWFGF